MTETLALPPQDGEYEAGRKHGVGTFTFASGRTWSGVFEHGKQGKAVETYAPNHALVWMTLLSSHSGLDISLRSPSVSPVFF